MRDFDSSNRKLTLNQMECSVETFSKINVAHVRERDKKIQTVEDHLMGTGSDSEKYTSEIGLDSVGMILGLLHDLGKATEVFREYLLSETRILKSEKKWTKGSIDHSTAGAQYFCKMAETTAENKFERIAAELMEICILSHHGGLIDCISEGKDLFGKRLEKSSEDTRLSEAEAKLDSDLFKEIDDVLPSAIKSLGRFVEQIYANEAPREREFKIGLLARFLLSCLVDADRTDTEDFEDPSNKKYRNLTRKVSWDELLSRYYNRISSYPSETEIDVIRKNVSNQCYNSAKRPKGLYTLSVPTGGGKTLSSLRFALEHLKEHGMNRIIYVVPYTTIIDQNAKTVRNILENEQDQGTVVLEHHSNLDPRISEDIKAGPWKFASENWDSPIVFTTMVQFLDSLFSSGTQSLRRMHNLSNSIIIFDEIQAIPMKVVYLFNEALNFLVRYCGATALLCTATQPLLNDSELKHRLNIPVENEIVEDVTGLFESLRRTEIMRLKDGDNVELEDVLQLIENEILRNESILIIVNTKKAAKEIHKSVDERMKNVNLMYLSTDLCPADRTQKMENMRELLERREKLICISTQLIEAGIDIDFSVVIRSMAGLDSIAQAAGRCNRHGRSKECGRVYVANISENVETLEDIKIGRSCSERVFNDNPGIDDVIAPGIMKGYFENYLYDRKGVMAYPLRGSDDMFELLSNNSSNYCRYKAIGNERKHHLIHAFRTANENFFVIQPTKSVIVQFDETAKDLVVELCSETLKRPLKQLLRDAQRYSVNLYENTFRFMNEKGLIVETSVDGIYYLVDEAYGKTYGIGEGTKMETMVM